jgi:hypothetical protein
MSQTGCAGSDRYDTNECIQVDSEVYKGIVTVKLCLSALFARTPRECGNMARLRRALAAHRVVTHSRATPVLRHCVVTACTHTDSNSCTHAHVCRGHCVVALVVIAILDMKAMPSPSARRRRHI